MDWDANFDEMVEMGDVEKVPVSRARTTTTTATRGRGRAAASTSTAKKTTTARGRKKVCINCLAIH
jgi:hypothetical protein